jgi:hypothetical protein
MASDDLNAKGWAAAISGGVLKADANVVVTVYGVTADTEQEALVRGTAQAGDLFKGGSFWPKQGRGTPSAQGAAPAPADDDAMPGFAVVIRGEVHDTTGGVTQLLGTIDARFGCVRADSEAAAIARAAAALGRRLQAEVFHVLEARASKEEKPKQPRLPLGAERAAERLRSMGATLSSGPILEVPSDVDPETGEVDAAAAAASRRRRKARGAIPPEAGPDAGTPSGSAA